MENNNKEWKLVKFSLEQMSFGVDKGKYKGRLKFGKITDKDGVFQEYSDEEITINISDEDSLKYLQLAKKQIIKNAKEFGKSLAQKM